MADRSCNGWSNWETWLVNVWFGEILTGDAESMKEQVSELIEGDTPGTGFVADLISGCLNSVNWRELAAHAEED